MAELPTGTVTFLFTDIEGSTKLLDELGEQYADVLAEHRHVLRKAFSQHSGVEVDTQGDAFFVAFERASDAVGSAADAQRELGHGPVRVRMGIHTGEPLQTDEGYVGMDIHRAARIAAAGHGGQILVSQTARDLVEADLPTEFALHDLGQHRLKDLSAPQHIFQLVGDGLEREFPALSTLANHPTNLPTQPTRLIGREHELAEVAQLMRRPDVRLLTVTGPGGAGKTRLVLQAAADLLDDFADGVFLISLAEVRETRLVVPTIAEALGVRESGGLSAEDALAGFVQERKLLLVLDNFEHLLDAAPQVHRLVLKGRSVRAISSSRAPLRVSGELEYPIPELGDEEAVALFSERARAIKPDFALNGDTATVEEICRRLDCLPLAIELAAARANLLSPGSLLDRLEQSLPMLTTGARDLPDRQRTLRDTIAWSYQLLDASEQRLFSRLALFVGGFSLDACERVCDADLDALGSLVEKSLVRQRDDRFRMLETIREFARERLDDSGEIRELGRRYIEYFLELAGIGGSDAQAEVSEWLDRLDPELDNLRTALNLAGDLDYPELELRLATALAGFWEYRGFLQEGLERIQEALDRNPEGPVETRGEALGRGSLIAVRQGDHTTARQMAEQMRRLYSESDDESGVAAATNRLGSVASAEGQYDEARALLQQANSMFDRLSDDQGLQATFHNLGLVAMNERDFETARVNIESGLRLARKSGQEQPIANATCDLGLANLGDGRLDEARALFQEAYSRAARMGWTENTAYCLVGFSALALAADELETAGKLLGQVDQLVENIHLTFLAYAERVREDVESELRVRLGEDRFETCRMDGSLLSMEAVTALVD